MFVMTYSPGPIIGSWQRDMLWLHFKVASGAECQPRNVHEGCGIKQPSSTSCGARRWRSDAKFIGHGVAFSQNSLGVVFFVEFLAIGRVIGKNRVSDHVRTIK